MGSRNNRQSLPFGSVSPEREMTARIKRGATGWRCARRNGGSGGSRSAIDSVQREAPARACLDAHPLLHR